jgi:hypothetical protein
MENNIEDLLKQKVKKIEVNNGNTEIFFENNTTLKLNGQPFDLPEDVNVPTCIFCGHPSGIDAPLFSVDNKNFICKDCVSLAYKTYVSNGIPMPIDIKVEGIGKDDKK